MASSALPDWWRNDRRDPRCLRCGDASVAPDATTPYCDACETLRQMGRQTVRPAALSLDELFEQEFPKTSRAIAEQLALSLWEPRPTWTRLHRHRGSGHRGSGYGT